MPAKQVAPSVREFTTGANRDRVDGKLAFHGFVSAKASRRFGAYMNKNRRLADGSLREPDNWKRGIPMPVYAESMMRHAQEVHELLEDAVAATGIKGVCDIASVSADHPSLLAIDEAASALWFNVQGWLHERVKAMDLLGNPYPGKRVHGKPPITYPEAERLILDWVADAAKKIRVVSKLRRAA